MLQIKTPKLLLVISIITLTNYELVLAANEPTFRFDGLDSRPSTEGDTSTARNSSLIWQPLRATFRPLNRRSDSTSFRSPLPPPPPIVASPPPAPEAAALVRSDTSDSLENRYIALAATLPLATTGTPTTTASVTNPPPILPSISSQSPTPSPLPAIDDDDQPTRVPLSRFRPTKAPSEDPQSQPMSLSNAASGSQNNLTSSTPYRISNECFECICEASTSCNINSRCQTSDVRHTRCGMFLISYDQWLETGLSSELVTREALARDAAADERAFYDCVTNRECAERLMSIYMQKNAKDCDKDGRIDCYDVAAVHQGGVDQCSGETLLESQYWSDFNACFGFGR